MAGGANDDLQGLQRVMFRKWFRVSGPRDFNVPEGIICLEIHHGGYFEKQVDGSQKYKVKRSNVSGGVCWADRIMAENLSWYDLCSMAYELGYREKPISFHFKLPRSTVNEGWIPLKNDGDCQEMVKLVPRRSNMVSVYFTGGGRRRVEEAMNDELGINPPRPEGWLNPLTLMTPVEMETVEMDANIAAIQLYAQEFYKPRSKEARNKPEIRVATPAIQENMVSGFRVEENVIVLDESGDESVPLGSVGPLPNLSQFIDDIGTQTAINDISGKEGHSSHFVGEYNGRDNACKMDRAVSPPLKKFGSPNRVKHTAGRIKSPHWLTKVRAVKHGCIDIKKPEVSEDEVHKEVESEEVREESNNSEEHLREEAHIREEPHPQFTEEPQPQFTEEPQPQFTEEPQPQFTEAPDTQRPILTQEDRNAWEEYFAEEEVFGGEQWDVGGRIQTNSQEPSDLLRKEKGKATEKEKRNWKDKKSSASRGVNVPVRQAVYNTRNKGKKHFEPQESDSETDSSTDFSFLEDSDYDLRESADDLEFNENVASGDHVEEYSAMGYEGVISDDSQNSDDLSSLEGSDGDFDLEQSRLSKEERRQRKIKAWNRRVDLVNPQFALGQLFPNSASFREAVREYHIRTRRGVWFKKNQREKIEIRCQTGCPFYIYAKLLKDRSPTFQIATFKSEHKCDLLTRSIHFNYNRVAAEIREQLLVDPGWTCVGIQEILQKKYNLDIPIYTIQRGKTKAMRMNEGHYIDQYNLLYAYRKELKRSNPGTTCEIYCSWEDGVARFKRIYICFAALKDGWRSGCRPLIGLDGTHIRGKHPGVLLCAVGIDANNGMYPIAYAVAEIENTETWSWFLEFLGDDLGINDSCNYTFISDKQKGIGNAIKRFFPESEHRHCVRHLYNNFKLAGHTGEGLKQTFWNAASCSRTVWWEGSMLEMKAQSIDAWNWFQDEDKNAIHWSRSHFRFTCGCDILINNICEVFNSSILTARSKPILTMLEMIRIDLMLRMANRRAAVTKWRHVCGPRIFKQIEKTSKWTSEWRALMAGVHNYQVQGGIHGTMHSVDLKNRTCSCRKWELGGVPCVHVICVLRSKQWDPTKFVSEMLKSDAYKRAYDPILMPIADKSEWEKVYAPVAPPPYKKQVGRPQMKRRPSAGENLAPPPPTNATKLSRKGMKMHCRVCNQEGHNSIGCPVKKKVNGEGSSNRCVEDGGNSIGKRKRATRKAPPKPVADKAKKDAANFVIKSRGSAKQAKVFTSNSGGGTSTTAGESSV